MCLVLRFVTLLKSLITYIYKKCIVTCTSCCCYWELFALALIIIKLRTQEGLYVTLKIINSKFEVSNMNNVWLCPWHLSAEVFSDLSFQHFITCILINALVDRSSGRWRKGIFADDLSLTQAVQFPVLSQRLFLSTFGHLMFVLFNPY